MKKILKKKISEVFKVSNLFTTLLILSSVVTTVAPMAQVRIAQTHDYISNPEKINRKFSKFALKGELQGVYFPVFGNTNIRYALIDNIKVGLIPGVTLRNKINQLIIPPSNVKVPANIAFILVNKRVSKMWLLTDEENKNFEKYKFK